MNKFIVLKKVGTLIVSLSTATVVTQSLKNLAPKNIGKFKKLGMWIGTVVLSSIVSDMSMEYAKDKFEEFDIFTEEEELIING